jgi:hypothetical protein
MMDKNIWLKVIKQELALLDDLASGMMEDPDLSKEEVELALARSKVVSGEFEMLLHQISQHSQAAKQALMANAREKPEEAVIPPTAAILPEPEPETIVVPKLVEVEKPAPEVRITESAQPVMSPVAASVIVETSSPVVAETQEQADVLYDDQKEPAPQFRAAPLKSLKEGMSLNDRFLFQRELFGNDKSRLDDTVSALDRLQDIKEAVTYLKSNFKWTKSEASEKFVQLVKRRFS